MTLAIFRAASYRARRKKQGEDTRFGHVPNRTNMSTIKSQLLSFLLQRVGIKIQRGNYFNFDKISEFIGKLLNKSSETEKRKKVPIFKKTFIKLIPK
jgi:hypothetical protein